MAVFWRWLGNAGSEPTPGGATMELPFPDDWKANIDAFYVDAVEITSEANGVVGFSAPTGASIGEEACFGALEVYGQPSQFDLINPWIFTEGYVFVGMDGIGAFQIVFKGRVVSNKNNNQVAMATFGIAIYETAMDSI